MNDEATYEGGCHCGRVRFRARTALRVAYVCNCSICCKKALVHLIVTKGQFELVRGEDDLAVYTFGTHTARHRFCRFCGVHPFYTPRSHPAGVDVNVRCLDGDVAGRFELVPFDGRHWEDNVEKIL